MAFNLRNRSFRGRSRLHPFRRVGVHEGLRGTPVKFMHCLPAFHDPNTTVGREIMERTRAPPTIWKSPERVFGSGASIVFDQA
jgi:hypothetical protein